jgi:hypothetical protein
MITLWGHGNCAGIPRLSSYDEAMTHYKNVVPIRGRKEEVKPLGRNRRFTWYRIVEQTIANQGENSEYKVYTCQLYGQDVVSYFPNGDIKLSVTSWNNITLGAFMNFVLGGVGNIVSESGKWFFQNNRKQLFRFNNNMVLRKGEDGLFTPTEVVADRVHKINRKAINALRKKYKVVIDYGKTMLALDHKIGKLDQLQLRKNGITSNRFVPYHNWESKDSYSSRAKWFELANKQIESGDLELLYDLAQYVAMASGRYSYRDDTYSCEPEWYVNYLDDMIKHQYAEEVFTVEELPIGQASADRNKRYVTVRKIY